MPERPREGDALLAFRAIGGVRRDLSRLSRQELAVNKCVQLAQERAALAGDIGGST